jgi:hypothetical protein
MAACAAFHKESRMKFANATKSDRKSGVAKWRDLQFLLPSTQDRHSLRRRFDASRPAGLEPSTRTARPRDPPEGRQNIAGGPQPAVGRSWWI